MKEENKNVENKEELKKVKETNNKVANKEKKAKGSGDKKKSKSIIWVIVVIAIIAIIAVMVGTILLANSPKNTLNEILTALKTGDYRKIENYNQLISDSKLLSGDESTEETQKLLFEKLEWDIKDEKQDGDIATINIDIKNKNFKKIIENYTQKIIKAAFSEEEITEEQIENYLMEELSNEETEIVTVNQTITMKKIDGKWAIEDTEATIYSLLPGLQEAIEALQ